MEKPTTDEIGSEDLEVEAVPSPAAGRSKDAHDFLGTGGAEAGTGADAEAGAGTVEVEVEIEIDGADGGAGVEVSTERIGATATCSVASPGGASWVAVGTATLAVGSHGSAPGLVCEWAVPAADTEVLEEIGEAGTGGVSDTVETSVSEEETVSGR
jgi:hypothetical protein